MVFPPIKDRVPTWVGIFPLMQEQNRSFPSSPFHSELLVTTTGAIDRVRLQGNKKCAHTTKPW